MRATSFPAAHCRAGAIGRALHALAALVLWVGPALASAQTDADAELKRLGAALNRISQAQHSVYQQFQMVQELRRAELGRRPDPFVPQPNVGPPRDYNELQQERKARETRIKDLTAELDRLYARYQELEEQKRPLLERTSELARAR
jgi:predicted  nucleic acid-binding Zn-ribbon protein